MPETIQRSFTSGEIAPAIQSRADLAKYSNGLNRCENFFVRAQGGVYSRPGLKHIGALDDPTKQGRLIPFSFNTTQTYMLVFEHLKMRVIKDGGFVDHFTSTVNTLVALPDPSLGVTVTTAFAHGLADGDLVTFSGATGMTEINGGPYVVTATGGGSQGFFLYGVDATGWGVYTGGGLITPSKLYEITTPYTQSELSRLSYTQSADVMTIVHPNHDPMDLSRLGHDNWTLVAIDYSATVTPPTFPASSTGVITGVTKANPALVTVTGHGFMDGQTVEITGVNGMIELNNRLFTINVTTVDDFELVGEDSTAYAAYTTGGSAERQNSIQTVGTGFGSFDKFYAYVVTAVDANGIESLASTEVNTTSKSLSTTGGVRISWNAVVGAVYYRVYKDPSNNTKVYGWIGDSTTASFDDYNVAPITSDAPPEDRQPFTGAGNKPSAVNYYQQRQVFANTLNEPQVTFTTQVNDFKSLRTSNPARTTDAITFIIAAQQVNEIRHILSLDRMVLLTSGGEWVVSEDQNRVMNQTAGVRIQSYNGSSWVKPVVVNSTALYLQEKNARIRDLAYEFNSDQYTGNDLSIMSEHLFEEFSITDMSYSDEPYGILWCVRSDGVMLGLTYLREHQVWGWHQHTTEGLFESVATISEDGRDAVYTIVNRTINGATARYVERFEKRELVNAEDAFCVDSGLSYNGAATTVFSGLDHLEGKSVAVLADGVVVSGKTVVSGVVTLDRAAVKVHIGLPFTPVIETLDIDTVSPAQTLKSRSLSVSKVYIEVEGSRGGFVGPRQDANSGQPVTFQEATPRFDSDGYDAISLKTYKLEVSIEPNWGKGGGIRIEQRDPLPMAILSVIPRVDIGGS